MKLNFDIENCSHRGSVEELVGEVGSTEGVLDLGDLLVDGFEFVLEECDFVLFDVVGFGFEEAENGESGDLLVMGLDLDGDLVLLLLGIFQLLCMSRHLATRGNVVISLGKDSEEGEVLKVVGEGLFVFVSDEEENPSLEVRVAEISLLRFLHLTIASDSNPDLFKVRLGEIRSLGSAHVQLELRHAEQGLAFFSESLPVSVL